MMLKAMLLSATALATSVRGTVPNTSVLRMVRSNTMPTPASRVKAKRCHICTRFNASPAASANETITTINWLNASARRRSKRSATTPEMGASSSMGIARIASTAPSRVLDWVRSYTTQPSVALCTHCPPVEQNVPIHKRRKSRWRSAAKLESDTGGGLVDCRFTGLQVCRFTGLQGYRVTGLRGHKKSRAMPGFF